LGPAQASAARGRASLRHADARTTIETCARLNIEALTLYAFFRENWRRPETETDFLMALLARIPAAEML